MAGGIIGDTVRKIVSLVVLVVAVVALIAFIMAAPELFSELGEAFSLGFKEVGMAFYNIIDALSTPLIMLVLGLIGVTVDK